MGRRKHKTVYRAWVYDLDRDAQWSTGSISIRRPRFIRAYRGEAVGRSKYGFWSGGETEVVLCKEWLERLLDIDFKKSDPFYSNQRIPIKLTVEWDERDIEEWYDPKREKK